MSEVGERVVVAARGWIGTPYRHQASVKGVGCDCLGLVRGVWREVVGDEPERVPPYSPDWAEVVGEETLLEAARRYLVEIALGEARVGDVLLFRMGLGAVAKHVAIVSGVETQAAHPDESRDPDPHCSLAPDFRRDERGERGEFLERECPLAAVPRSPRSGGQGASRIIHAYWSKAVCETRLVPWWRRRIAGAFRFPELMSE